MIRRPVLAALVLFALAFASSGSLVADEGEVLADRWDLLRMAGAPVGHLHTVVRRVPGEGGGIETVVDNHMLMNRLGATVSIDSTTTTLEREDGALVSVRERSMASKLETVTEVSIAEGKAHVKTTAAGKTTEVDVPLPKKPLGPWRVERIPVDAGLKADETYELPSFVPNAGPVVATILVVGPEEVEGLDGAKRSLVRMDSRLDVFPIRTSAWVDAAGDPLQTRTEVAGMVVETFRTTKEKATATADGTTTTPDMFMASMIKTSHLIPHARSLEGALLRLRITSPEVEVPQLDDARQKVEKREGDTILLRVRHVVPPEGAGGRRPLANPPPEMARYLASTAMLQVDDPLIRKTAEEAVAGETDAWKAARAIEQWVYRGITKKNMGVAFASALEVCRDREGDCTEHAVLVAALCRAAGIPSRVVMGLAYLTGIFGGHAWSEVWIEGHWYALDAALSPGHVDPLHLALGSLAMEDATYGREYGKFIGALGGLHVDVLEATWRGRTIRFEDAGAVGVEGGSYVNRPWGLSVRAPDGFTLKPRGPEEGLSQRLVDLEGSAAGKTRHLRVRAESVDPAEGLAEAVKPYAKDAALTSTTIDGRPALVGTVHVGGASARAAFVVDDVDSLFAFSLEPSDSDADAALLDSFLEGVDLDAETAPAR